MGNNNQDRNFGWSLKPITVLMAFFGQEIVIDRSKEKRNSYSLLILGIGVAILLINIVINTMSFMSVCIVLYRNKISTTDYVNFIVGHVFHDLVVIGVPLSFTTMRIFSRRWKELLSTLEHIQSDMNLSKQLYRKIRYCVFISIVFLVFVSFEVMEKGV